MTYPADATYTAQDLEDVRGRIHDAFDQADELHLTTEFLEGAESVLIWLAGGKQPSELYAATNSYVARLAAYLLESTEETR